MTPIITLLREYVPKEFATAKLGFLAADHVKRALSPDLIATALSVPMLSRAAQAKIKKIKPGRFN